MESNDALDWIEDKKPVEEIKDGVGIIQHGSWRHIKVKNLESSSYGAVLKG